jgi:CDP-glucose 4,6-dehydratase
MSRERLNEFWAGRHVLLTGHTGFKGSWLSLLLAELGAKVHGFALAPPAGEIFEAANVATRLASSTIGDIRDLAGIQAAFDTVKPDIVIHMAAQSLVKKSYTDPIETFAVNVMGTANVLEAIRRIPGVSAALMITSDKCYENREWIWGYREDEAMGGYDPYSASKGCAELVTAAYRRSFFSTGTKIATARAGNVIGGGDWAVDRLVPDFVRSVQAGKSSLIRNPTAIRPWQHVLDPIAGYLLLVEALLSGPDSSDSTMTPQIADYTGGWNFGPDIGSERCVGEVMDSLCAHWSDAPPWQIDRSPRLHEAQSLRLDSTKARARLGWRPQLDFDQAVFHTIVWYKAALAGGDMAAFTRAQIQDYLESRHRTDLG